MNNQIPSINQLLDTIDPGKTIDREKAMKDFSTFSVLKSLSEFANQADSELKGKLKNAVENFKTPDMDLVFKAITDAGKMEEFLKILNSNIESMRMEYIKTHLAVLSSKKKEKLYSKFPTLKDLN